MQRAKHQLRSSVATNAKDRTDRQPNDDAVSVTAEADLTDADDPRGSDSSAVGR